jgi:hypothetical protein
MVQSKVTVWAILLVVVFVLVSCGQATKLTIVTVPSGSEVAIDGEKVDSPVKGLVVKPGIRDVFATHVGYLPNSTAVEVVKGRDNLFCIDLLTEREFVEEIKPGVPNHGFRIRTSPDTKDSICYIANISNGEIREFDLEETTITGDWNKILPLAGFDESVLFNDVVGLVVCDDGQGNYGVCTVGSKSDSVFGLKKVSWDKNPPDWNYLVANHEEKSKTVHSKNDNEKINIQYDDTVLDSYFGEKLFHGRENGTIFVWNYIDKDGRQTVSSFDRDEVKSLWYGEWALGALRHINNDANVIDFVDNETVATVICTKTGYELVIIKVDSSKIVTRMPIDKFPVGLSVGGYGNIFGITMTFANECTETYTWTQGLGFAQTPEIANGSFDSRIGIWLPVGPNQVELRFPNEIPLSVCFEEQDGKMIAIWAGIR